MPDGDRRFLPGGGAETVRPKALLVSVLPYLLSTRVAISLQDVGFDVEVVCPVQHPLHLLSRPPRAYPLGLLGATSIGPFGARAAVANAIRVSAPDVVAPCDDQAVAILHDIRRKGASAKVNSVIEASLGPAASYDVLESKSAQVTLARRLGIRTPASVPLAAEDTLRGALTQTSLPAFLKRDGTWAGQGVARIENEAQAFEVFAGMAREHTLLAALRRVRTHGWRFSLAGIHGRRPAIDLQACIAGRPANHAVICKDGQVLASISLAAVETTSGAGPAAVVQVIDNAEMRDAAVRLVEHLGLSGFLGFDFILDDAGEAYFLEINARATPACALATTRAADLPAVLYSTFSGKPARPRATIAQDLIALFPNELERDPASPYLQSAYHDVPVGEPALFDFGCRSVGVEAVMAAPVPHGPHEAKRQAATLGPQLALIP